MAISLRITMLFLLLSFFLFRIVQATTTGGLQTNLTTSPSPPPPPFTSSPPPPPPPLSAQDIHDFIFSHKALLTPILSHLGYHDLAVAAHSLSSDSSTPTTAWSGPFTLFAPSDSSVRTCYSCSVPSLLREHMVPGLFTVDYLRRLAFGTKIETLSPARCITVTLSKNNGTTSNVFIGGVPITHPDLFNNGLIVIHGIQGYISPLSPFSCDVQRMSSLSFPIQQDRSQQIHSQPSITRVMLRDAILRLRNNGFTMLSLAMKVKYAELVTLSNMTIFALDDVSIFSGSHSYLGNVRFHIVPNRYLTMADLERFPVGTTLPTLERGQDLVVTTGGGGFEAAPVRINYVRVKVPDVMRNLKIVVHSVFLPFPHIHPVTAAYEGTFTDPRSDGGDHAAADRMLEEDCSSLEDHSGSWCGPNV